MVPVWSNGANIGPIGPLIPNLAACTTCHFDGEEVAGIWTPCNYFNSDPTIGSPFTLLLPRTPSNPRLSNLCLTWKLCIPVFVSNSLFSFPAWYIYTGCPRKKVTNFQGFVLGNGDLEARLCEESQREFFLFSTFNLRSNCIQTIG